MAYYSGTKVKDTPPERDALRPPRYSVGPRRAITIFGGYPVRDVLAPDGTVLITVTLASEQDLLNLDKLIVLLNAGLAGTLVP